MRNDLKLLITTAAVLGCGDSGGRDEFSDSASASIGTLSGATTVSPDSSSGATTTSESSSSGTTSTTSESSDGDSSEPTSAGDESGAPGKFDLGVLPDLGVVPDDDCGNGGGDSFVLSYIWIANSTEGTISKINTQTLIEEGRYIVRPDKAGNPSRTSVNLSGDVAVANRAGGLTKVYARPEDCVESNGMPGIQTSTDSTPLPWGVEECVAWYTEMNYDSQRPVAWTQGTYNEETCKYEGQKVWTSGHADGAGTVEILKVNGDNGQIEASIQATVKPDPFGLYGGAVDKHGNFWATQSGITAPGSNLMFVDFQTMQVKTWPVPAKVYGMTVDSAGYVWTCATEAARFDPMTEQWQKVLVGEYGGCMEDGKGTLYKPAVGGGLAAIDTETLAIKQIYDLPEHIHGVSIDFHGYVWGVGHKAYRLDPADGQYQTFTGLTGAYTYSDMTGFALSHAGAPPG